MGGDPTPPTTKGTTEYFNPRLPDGRRPHIVMSYGLFHVFQSTPPGWEATAYLEQHYADYGISIHASRMGGDRLNTELVIPLSHFNPRLPDGRRHETDATTAASTAFQSTPPGWEATVMYKCHEGLTDISIHASRMGGDHNDREAHNDKGYFNPRLPDGRRLVNRLHHPRDNDFNPRLPDGRRQAASPWTATPSYFNPRLPDGRRPPCIFSTRPPVSFQSTPPGWEATVKMDTPFHDMERIFILVINRTALY